MAKETASIYIKLQTGEAVKNIDNVAKAFTQARREARLAEKGSAEYIEATRRVRELKRELDEHNKLLGRTGSAWDNVKKIALGVFGGNLISAGISKVAAVLRQGAEIVNNFEEANSRLNAVMGKTSKETEELRKQQLELGRSTAFTASQAADAQTELAKLGFTIEQIKGLTPAVLDLAAASGTDLANAATIAGNTLRQFDLDARESQRVVDVMAKSFSSSALDIEKFSGAMENAGPVAKSAGVSLERTTALIGTLVDRGIAAPKAGTALRNMFLTLSKEGITFEDAMNRIRTATDQNAAALEMFGTQGATAAVIISNTTDAVTELEEKLKDASGAAKEMAEGQLDNLRGDMIKLTSAWEGFVLSIENGEGIIAKASRRIVQSLTSIFDTIADQDLSAWESFVVNFGGNIPGLNELKMQYEAIATGIKVWRQEADQLADADNIQGLTELKRKLEDQRDETKEGTQAFRLLNREIERLSGLQRTVAERVIGAGLTTEDDKPTDTTTTTSSTEKQKTPEEIRAEKAKLALEALKESYDEEKLYLAEDRLNGIIDEEQYQKELQALKIASLLFQKEALQEIGMDTVSIEQQIADEQIKIINKVDAARQKAADEEARRAERQKEIDEAAKKAEEERYEAAIKSATLSAIASIEGAETMEEAARMSINAIRGVIKGYIAEAIAATVAQSLKSTPPPMSLILATAAGAASSLLFDSLIPAFAKGTNFAPGGMALVGEEGPELVNLPKGSKVFTAQQTNSLITSGKVFGEKFTGNSTPPPTPTLANNNGATDPAMLAVIAEIRSWQRDLQVTFSNRSKEEWDDRLTSTEKQIIFRKN